MLAEQQPHVYHCMAQMLRAMLCNETCIAGGQNNSQSCASSCVLADNRMAIKLAPACWQLHGGRKGT